MTQFQVRPQDDEESLRVQKALFMLGYRWQYGISTPDGLTPVVGITPGWPIKAYCDGILTIGCPSDADEIADLFPVAKIEKVIAEAERRQPAARLRDTWPVKQFWMVKEQDGGPASLKHKTRDDAELEAVRLAKKNPGKVFCVLEVVSAFAIDIPAEPTEYYFRGKAKC